MVDFGKTTDDYSKHRSGFPKELYTRLAKLGVGIKGQTVLDIGTGTGTVARTLAKQGCHVTATDISSEMIGKAKELARGENLQIDFSVSPAEETSFNDERFDIVIAGQCWHWFDSHKVMQECYRLLKPNGKLAIIHFDWLPENKNIPELTEKLIEKHNPNWKLGGGNGLYPQWGIDASANGFTNIESFHFDIDAIYSHEAWRGRIRASVGISASLSQDEVEAFDKEHVRMLKENFPEDPLYVPHRVWAMIAEKK